MTVPEITGGDVAFGNIAHLPKYETLPEEFREEQHPACKAIDQWFCSGVKSIPNGIEVGGTNYVAREGVNANKALQAIRAALRSFEPKHEHKIAGCGYLLNEWFQAQESLP